MSQRNWFVVSYSMQLLYPCVCADQSNSAVCVVVYRVGVLCWLLKLLVCMRVLWVGVCSAGVRVSGDSIYNMV